MISTVLKNLINYIKDFIVFLCHNISRFFVKFLKCYFLSEVLSFLICSIISFNYFFNFFLNNLIKLFKFLFFSFKTNCFYKMRTFLTNWFTKLKDFKVLCHNISGSFMEFLKFLIKFIKKVLDLKLYSWEIKFFNFIYCKLNKLKDFIYRCLFGENSGIYNNVVLFPQIILNNTLLLEFKTVNTERVQRFFWNMFRDFNYWDEKKEKIFESKLMELLEGKTFPLESPFFSQTESKPFNFSFPLGTSSEKMFYPTNLSDAFTLKLYDEWKKDPEFLTYVICYYFAHYIISYDMFDVDEVSNVNLRNKLLTLDLSPFFIYKEQADSVAKDLLIMFKEELKESYIKKYTFSFWLDILIKNLLKVDFLPSEKNKNKKSIKNWLIFYFYFF